MPRDYTCALCGKSYLKTWPDEAAEQECLEVFGLDPGQGGCELVCDDCYQRMLNAT